MDINSHSDLSGMSAIVTGGGNGIVFEYDMNPQHRDKTETTRL